MLFMIDTCQANTMYSKFYSPNILATGSSALKENSYSVSRAVSHLGFRPLRLLSLSLAPQRSRYRCGRH